MELFASGRSESIRADRGRSLAVALVAAIIKYGGWMKTSEDGAME